jgi:malate synthase
MNMPAYNSINNDHDNRTFIAEAVFAVETIKSQQTQEKQTKAKLLLDAIFPLDQRSHEDATSYLLDGRHLMVYFKDGQHTGLMNAGSFVAFTGHRSHPDTLLLRDKEGCYVEVSFKRGTNEGMQSSVEISDIQLETCATFSHSYGDEPKQGIRHWVSLLKTDSQGQPRASLDDKDFTAKNGDDYRLTCCFKK